MSTDSSIDTIFLPQVEELAGIKKNTIYALIKAGQFPANKPMRDVPSLRVWLKSEVIAWRNAQWVA